MRNKLMGLAMAAILTNAGINAGCGSTHSAGMCAEGQFPAAKQGDLAATEAAAQAAWSGRKDVAKLREAIGHWKEAVAIDPRKSENYVHLGRAVYFLADGYTRLEMQRAEADSKDDLQESKEEEMVALLEESFLTSEKAIRLQNEDYQSAACNKEPLEDSIATLKKSDLPAVYWYAVALGKYGLATSIVTVLNNKEKIFQMMSRIEKLDPEYFYHASDRYFGGYYTKVPFPSGDLEESRKRFERSLRNSPNYLATRVLFAEMWATRWKDKVEGKKIFDEQLKLVESISADVLPEVEAENLLEKEKAKMLKEKFDESYWED